MATRGNCEMEACEGLCTIRVDSEDRNSKCKAQRALRELIAEQVSSVMPFEEYKCVR